MKKNVLPIIAAAMALTFTACQPTDKVDPAVIAIDTNPDELVSSIVNFLAAPGNTSTSGGINKAQARWAKPSPAEIKSAFDAIDADYSGQISTTELFDAVNNKDIPFFTSPGKGERKLVKEINKEVKNVISEEQAAQLIKMFDVNNNGMMEFNEFDRLIDEALNRK